VSHPLTHAIFPNLLVIIGACVCHRVPACVKVWADFWADISPKTTQPVSA